MKGFGIAMRTTPLKINMEHNSLQVWKIIFLSKWVICRFHVNLPKCTSSNLEVKENSNRPLVNITPGFKYEKISEKI